MPSWHQGSTHEVADEIKDHKHRTLFRHRQTSIMEITRFMVGLFIIGIAAGHSVIVRQNYGVIFRIDDTPLIKGVTGFEFAYAVNFTLRDELIEPPKLVTFVRHEKVNRILLRRIERLDELTSYEYNVLKTQHLRIHDHSKRRNIREAILQPLGDLLGSIIGSATEPEVQRIRVRLNKISNIINLEFNRYQDMAKLIFDMTNFNLRNMRKHVGEHNLTLEALYDIKNNLDIVAYNSTLGIDRLLNDLYVTERHALLLHVGVMQLSSLSKYNTVVANLIREIELLSTGQLSSTLVPITTLSSTLMSLNEALVEGNISLRICDLNPSYYYKNPIKLYKFSEETLYISIRIPLCKSRERFDLYKTTIVNVPVETHTVSNHGYTKLVEAKQYIALSRDDKQFIELNNGELVSCPKHSMYVCEMDIPVRLVSRPTCLLALFLDNVKLAHDLCSFKVTHNNALAPIAIPLNPGEYLVRTDNPVSITNCEDESKILHNVASYIVVHVPCQCSITTGGLSISNYNAKCLPTTEIKHIVYHTCNLPIIYHFNVTSFEISGSALTLHRRIFESKSIDRLAHYLKHDSMYLTKHALDLRNTARVINSEAHHTSRYINLLSTLGSVVSHPIVEFVSLILSVVALAVCFYLWRKIGGIWTIVMFGRGSRAINMTAWNEAINSFKIINKEHVSNGGIPDSVSRITGQYHEFAVLVMIVVCIYLVKKYISCRSRRLGTDTKRKFDTPYLALKVYRAWDSILIPLSSIKYEPNLFTVCSGAPVLDFYQTGCFKGTMDLRWQGKILLAVNGVQEEIKLPYSVYIPIAQRYDLWKVLRHPTTPRYGLVIVHRDKQHQISLSKEVTESKV